MSVSEHLEVVGLNKVVFLYDFTGFMAAPWLAAGYECWCFDGQHPSGVTRCGNLVTVGMWFDAYKVKEHTEAIKALVGGGVVLVFGFPECTQLTVAGARHWESKRKVNPNFQVEAMQLADLVRQVGDAYGCPWAFENPVGALSTMYRKPNFKFDPYHYGGYLPLDDKHPLYPEVYPSRDRYQKGTCIWSGNGFKEPIRKPLARTMLVNPGWACCGGKSLRTKNIRSATPRGFARAVFEAHKL